MDGERVRFVIKRYKYMTRNFPVHSAYPESKKGTSPLVLSAFILASAAALAALSFCAVRLHQQVVNGEPLKELAQNIALVAVCFVMLLALVVTFAVRVRRPAERLAVPEAVGTDYNAPNMEGTQAMGPEPRFTPRSIDTSVSAPSSPSLASDAAKGTLRRSCSPAR
ncbi:hypothetical protein [Neorickettsia sp. 179522]|uniref:hypothetical protein n=1 Tax=Neorickettsia sp. 179522 TaxID=1714371 RepID=UPI0007937276|nr:hypothetical protein [Neorickettsia sp. 179522]KYH12299.1 hypothetical protein AS219_00510 [Neorickettsia sp. 179522]